jgi:hypothetical protein
MERIRDGVGPRSAADAQLFPQFSLTGGVTWQSSGLNSWLQSSNRSVFIGPAARRPGTGATAQRCLHSHVEEARALQRP